MRRPSGSGRLDAENNSHSLPLAARSCRRAACFMEQCPDRVAGRAGQPVTLGEQLLFAVGHG